MFYVCVFAKLKVKTKTTKPFSIWSFMASISLTLPKIIVPGNIPKRDNETPIFAEQNTKHFVSIHYTTSIQKLKSEL